MDTKWYLRLEAVAVAGAALSAYLWYGEPLLWLAVLFFAPDVSAVGYLVGPATGALTYNLVHMYVGPLALLGFGLWSGESLAVTGALIWLFHVGVDRSIGYGLKEDSFRETHLGRIGVTRSD